MKIFFKEEFKKILGTRDKGIVLGPFKLGTAVLSNDFIDKEVLESELTEKFVQKDQGISPSTGFYSYNYLERDPETLQISFDLPDTDLGVRSSLGSSGTEFYEDGFYSFFYGYYSDLEDPEDYKLGFILFEGLEVQQKIHLDNSINIINIPFKHNCLIYNPFSAGSQFLEGPGKTEYWNIYRNSEYYKDKYISVRSFNDLVDDIKLTDQYDHDNLYLNKFGIKIY